MHAPRLLRPSLRSNTGSLLVRGACACLLLSLPSHAARATLTTNPSFESGPNPGVYTKLPVGSTLVNGWQVTRNAVDYCGSRWDAAGGIRSIALNADTAGGIGQTIATVPNETYTVSFYMAGDAFSNPILKHMRVAAAGQFQDYTFNAEHAWPWGMGWLPFEFQFIASSSSTFLEFYSLDPDTTGPVLDSVMVSGPTVSVDPRSAELWLDPPRPNPSPAGFAVRFGLPREAAVRVTVHDLHGREVAVLADGIRPAGPQSLNWDGRGPDGRAPAGVYFIRLAAPDVTRIRKAVLSP